MWNNLSLTNTHWLFLLIYRIYLCIFEFETLYTAVAEAKAGASVTSCNQRFTCYWSRFWEIPFKTLQLMTISSFYTFTFSFRQTSSTLYEPCQSSIAFKEIQHPLYLYAELPGSLEAPNNATRIKEINIAYLLPTTNLEQLTNNKKQTKKKTKQQQ